jgi:hypothetical protein
MYGRKKLLEQGVCVNYTVALPFTLLNRILRQKKTYGNSKIHHHAKTNGVWTENMFSLYSCPIANDSG